MLGDSMFDVMDGHVQEGHQSQSALQFPHVSSSSLVGSRNRYAPPRPWLRIDWPFASSDAPSSLASRVVVAFAECLFLALVVSSASLLYALTFRPLSLPGVRCYRDQPFQRTWTKVLQLALVPGIWKFTATSNISSLSLPYIGAVPLDASGYHSNDTASSPRRRVSCAY
ncbi:hypothetical protein P3342_011312 [Pyrenophora teres f. teres]|nr:hypothetical protein P3342_011312 [Pyrenophora teres f. teres]